MGFEDEALVGVDRWGSLVCECVCEDDLDAGISHSRAFDRIFSASLSNAIDSHIQPNDVVHRSVLSIA